jgi:DNA repair protein RadC
MTDTKVFMIHDGSGARRAQDGEIVAAAQAILARSFRRNTALTSPRVARDYLALKYSLAEQELFVVLFLDNRHRLIECSELFRGTIDGASVHPREVVKAALSKNAAAVILVHNHPSGVAEPSQADEVITSRLRDALALVDIRVVDHLIVAGGGTVSMAERGLV